MSTPGAQVVLGITEQETDELLSFGCGVTDAYCMMMEQIARGMAKATSWLADETLGTQEFNTGSDLWNVATDQAGTWLGLSIMVMIITSVVGISVAAVMGRGDLMKRALIGTGLSLPATMFAYFIVGKGLDVVDELSDGMLDKLTGTTGGFGALVESVMWQGSALTAFSSLTSGGVPIPQVVLVLLAMFLGILFIAFAIAFRNFVLMLLIAFAPLAFVILPAQGGGVWVKRWISAVTAMALAKPLILGTLALVMAGFESVGSIWSPQGVSLLIGFAIAAFMPLMAYSFFNFIGGDGGAGDQVGSRGAGTVSQKVQQGGQHVQQFRTQQAMKGGRGAPGAAGSPAAGASAGAAGKTGGAPAPRVPTANPRPGAGPGSGTTFGQGPAPKPSVPKPPSPSSTP